jgi:peroxiredoxin
MPELIKLQHEYRTRGLQILGVTCPPERLTKVRRVTRKFKISYPVLLGSREMTRAYDAGDVLPITIIIDRDGRVRGRILGILERDEFIEKVVPLF